MRRLATLIAGVLVLGGCSSEQPRGFADLEPVDRGPAVVVSLPLLGDVVGQVVGGWGSVVVLSPDGRPGTLDAAQAELVADADLVLVHDADLEFEVVRAAAGGTLDTPRFEAVNEWLELEPVNPATWFDPIHMARIALELGQVLAAVDDDGLRSPGQWHTAAESVATSVASSFDEATRILTPLPSHCRQAVGDADLLAHLEARFAVVPAADDGTAAADLSAVAAVPAAGDHWQDWFLDIIGLLANGDADCGQPATPTSSPGSEA